LKTTLYWCVIFGARRCGHGGLLGVEVVQVSLHIGGAHIDARPWGGLVAARPATWPV
jgi:hypothetical protein